jgi:hypothetical protein
MEICLHVHFKIGNTPKSKLRIYTGIARLILCVSYSTALFFQAGDVVLSMPPKFKLKKLYSDFSKENPTNHKEYGSFTNVFASQHFNGQLKR